MIVRRISSRLPVIVYQPPKVFDPSYFASVHAAGGLPVLDTEFFANTDIIQMIEQLAQSDLLFGVRLAADNQAIREYLENNSIANMDLIVFSYRAAAELSGFQFTNRDYRFFIEVTDIKLQEALARIAPHGVIVKGQEGPGKVSRYSAFILLQWYLKNCDLPAFVHGGVGWHTAAGFLAMGAEGLVLDNQLYLSREAPLATVYKDLLRQLEEKDATVLGQSLGSPYHFFAKLGTRIVKTLRDREIHLAEAEDAPARLYREIETHIADLSQPSDAPLQSLFYLGQDAVFARHFARHGETVQDMLHGLFRHIGEQLTAVDGHDPLREDSPLAREHGTRYPILQGPMANVSDNPDFAAAVFEGGALPFFAMGNLPPKLADDMLAAGKEKVARFGAGMIGIEAFNQTIGEHLTSVAKHAVPFALFAGGIPSQVKALEAGGTKTYLHTPSLMMLENALQKDCRRFIFEGAEAGGHVGTLSSMVLWELAAEKMSGLADDQLADKTMIFAGGIGTAQAAHFISGMTAQLAARGVKIGIQVGTAYLFSCEIIETGAIQKIYQEVVCEHDETIVMGTTVGLASRTVATPFSRSMIDNEHSRLRDGLSLEARKKAFEKDNIGSLLIGAKAFCPKFDSDSGEVCFLHYDEKEQYQKGNFMVGDGLAFYPCSTTIADIHHAFFHCKEALHRQLNALEIFSSPRQEIEDEVAVIGMGCIYPDADSPQKLWDNVMAKHYAIGDIPAERMDPALYFDEDRKAVDKSYTKIAGVVRDFAFDHARYGYTPEKAARLSRSQQMVLEAAYRAVADAGYLEDDLTMKAACRASTAVIVATCLGNELGNDLHLKYWYPELRHSLEQIEAFNTLDDDARDRLLADLREGLANGVDYEPVHGQLLNIEAARIAHHLGLTGINYVVDAACATSFAALDCAVKELLSGEYDMVISGGVNTNLAPESFVGFCKMGALSAKGSYPFDARADGFVLGEGAGVLVLKRMKDALRDGDRIQAVVKGVGSSSDGKGKAIAAPNPEGQALALHRCYANMRDKVRVVDVDYIEAHGTSTIAGDQAEIETLKKVYCSERPIGISSIKSQIGHLLGGAGYAGMIKAILAIRHRTLPPNGRFETLAPAHAIADSPLFIIEEAKPWDVAAGRPRLAAVSSYGFGGINYHCVVAEHTPDYRPLPRRIFTDPDDDFNDRRIVFAGMGVVLPESPDVDSFWQNLSDGKSVLARIPEERFHNRAYADEPEDSPYHIPLVKAGVVRDYRFNNVKFRIPPATARSLDRAQLFALDAAQQAIASAALEPQLDFGNKVGVVLGTLPGERQVRNILRVRLGVIERLIQNVDGIDPGVRQAIAARLCEQVRDRIPENNEDTIPGLLSNIVSGRVANTFGCNGANFVVDASCASATVATRLAVKGLQSGDYDSVLTGGVDANFYPTVMLAFKRLSLLSGGDCRYFDKKAGGYVMSEGAAVLVMTTYGHARKHKMPILGEFHHSAFRSSVPDHLLAPSEKVYRDTMADCYRRLPITPDQIDHLDVFGVANVFLDQMEKQAIDSTFRRPVYFGNVKSEFGYFKSANPAVAMAKLLLMNRSRTLLPNYSYAADTSIVGPTSKLAANPRLQSLAGRQRLYFAANVNGVGGNHGHTVVGSLPPWLHTAEQSAAARPPAVAIPAKPNGVVALVSGQGAQYGGMMKELYTENATVRDIMDRGERIFQEMRGYSLLAIMFGEDQRLNQTENTQPAVFLSSAAVYTDLAARGFAPDRFIGHSVGEYSALYCAGLLDFEDAMRLIVKRADFMKAATEVQPGRIMVVFNDADHVHQLIRTSQIKDIYVANKNSDKQTAVSGAQAAIAAFGTYLKEAKVMFKPLALSGAFHTPLFESAAENMSAYLKTVAFHPVDFSRIISNVTAAPYPGDPEEVKALLVRQIVSPVEFIRSVERVHQSGHDRFYEIGPGRILVNLLKNIRIEGYDARPSVDAKAGECASLRAFQAHLEERHLLAPAAPAAPPAPPAAATPMPAATAGDTGLIPAEDFEAFLDQNQEALRGVLYQEFLKQKREQALQEVERFNFYTGKTVVAGTAVGLPGTGNKVFNANNFDKLLNGSNFIEPLSAEEKKKIVDMNITRVFKQPDGNARFLKITDTQDVIQLAGKLGYFNLKNEYGVDYDYDITIALAIAAGIEALKDAHIPLVLQHRKTSTGQNIPNGYALPRELQRGTGVIMTSLFPGFETLIEQLNKYYYNKFYVRPYKELENIYYHLMESVRDSEIKEQITDWFFKIKERRKKYGTYQFERNLLFDVVPLGSAHFAQLIKAKGPNMLMSGACASTTQAVGVAEDWIRTGRCERVIVIGGEASTSETQSPWIASGFLALGAASIKNVVAEAAKPFDADRNGTILGAGAVSLIVEREDRVRERGLNGQAEILGTYIGNSAYHATQIDLEHLTEEMAGFVQGIERRHGLARDDYAPKMVFMSHETYTPARGGSASAEVASLKRTFPEHYRDITITNTKGYTGHTLGAAIEDAVLVKALQQHQVPPIANLTNIPEEFRDLRFSRKASKGPFEYGLHYAAGFGSHFAFLMIRRVEEARAVDNPQYEAWLQKISGLKRPRLTTINNTLCVDPNVLSPVAEDPPQAAPAPAAEPAKPQKEAPPAAWPATPSVDVAATVKAIVAEQTGYTTDMLEDDLDLEADLGIDTVKQVEIFGKVSERFGLEVPEDLKLRDLNTIAKLGDYLARQVSGSPAAEEPPATPAAEVVAHGTSVAVADIPEDGVQRLVVQAVELAPTQANHLMKGQRVLITTNGGPYAAVLAEKIAARGGDPLIVGHGEGVQLRCDWRDPAEVARIPSLLKERGAAVDGLIHLVPLEGYTSEAVLNQDRITVGLKAFFQLIQGLYDQLDRPGTFIAVPTAQSTVFPYRDGTCALDPLMAGVAGLLKTVNKELAETRVKAVDFAAPASAAALAEALIAELLAEDPRVEVGVDQDRRWGLCLAPKAADPGERFVHDGDTLLVTGGARGITFEILKALIEAVQVRLVILGRSDIAALEPELADPTLEASGLMEKLKARMPDAKPVAVKKALDRILGLRASAANLATLRRLGAEVAYHAVDVTDAAAVAAAVAEAGAVDGVLHAAGLEESQMIPKKHMTSFDRVFDTKVMGLGHLLAALGDRKLRYLMTFSSVTARLGNAGQADYTAANDMIGKMLQHYRRRHPETRIKIFDWTAWEGAGMATNETVNKVLKERGLTFLPLAKGVAFFLQELTDSTADEVVFTGMDHAFDPDGLLSRTDTAIEAAPAPFIDQVVTATDEAVTCRRVLDLKRDRFLLDHAREAIPIFLGATGIETMAEAAALLAPPDAVLQELSDFSIPYGIKILKGRPKEILVEARRSEQAADRLACRITSQFRNPKGTAMGEPTLHYQGTYRFGHEPLPAERVTLPRFKPVDYEGNIQELLYHPSRLFMDGLFRTVEDIVSFEPDRLIARIVDGSDKPFFTDDPQPAFRTNVAVVDAMFQTGGMLEVMSTNLIVLPHAIGRMRFYRPVRRGAAYLCITEKSRQGTETNTYQLRLVDEAGRLHLSIEDFQMVQVDRLAKEDRILEALQPSTEAARRAS